MLAVTERIATIPHDNSQRMPMIWGEIARKSMLETYENITSRNESKQNKETPGVEGVRGVRYFVTGEVAEVAKIEVDRMARCSSSGS